MNAGFMADDHYLNLSLAQLPETHPLRNLFGLVTSAEEVRVFRDWGVLPWWTDDELRIIFWRPLPSMTHWLDWRVFGSNAAAMHLVSIGWYLLTVVLAWRVFARFWPARSVWVLLAVAVFALDDAHALNVQWIASRNDLVVTTFLFIALLGLLRVREGRSRGNLVWVYGGFAAALLSKESAVLFPFLALAHVLFIPGREPGSSSARVRRHAGLLTSLFAILAAYLLAYGYAGFGPHTLFYLNPLRAPVLWVTHLLTTGAAHAAVLASGVPLHTITPSPWTELPVAAAACALVTLAFFGLCWRFLRADASARFFGAWVVAGPLVTTGFPDPRLLFVASIGFAFLVARLAQALWTEGRTWRPLVGALLFIHLVLAPVVTQVSLGVVRSLREGNDEVAGALRTSVAYEDLPETGVEVFFLNWHRREVSPLATLWLVQNLPTGADVTPALHAPGHPLAARIERAFGELKVSYRPLSFLDKVSVEAVDSQTLRLSAPGGDFFPTVYEQLYFTSGAPRVGQRVVLPAFTATVEAVADDGRVTAVRFHFPSPLSSPRYRFLTWRDGAWTAVGFDSQLVSRHR